MVPGYIYEWIFLILASMLLKNEGYDLNRFEKWETYRNYKKLLETIQSERPDKLFQETYLEMEVYKKQEHLNNLIRAGAMGREAARQRQIDEEYKKNPTTATTTVVKGKSTAVPSKGKGKPSGGTKKKGTSKKTSKTIIYVAIFFVVIAVAGMGLVYVYRLKYMKKQNKVPAKKKTLNQPQPSIKLQSTKNKPVQKSPAKVEKSKKTEAKQSKTVDNSKNTKNETKKLKTLV